jgi:hypothetical protein
MRCRGLPALVAVVSLSSWLFGCDGTTETVEGVGGLDGVLVFEAPDDLVFSTNLAVGSTFEIVARPSLQQPDLVIDGLVEAATSDLEVMTVSPGTIDDDGASFTFTVTVVGGGRARLAVARDGKVLDRFTLNAVPLGKTTLIDGSLLSWADNIDVTLPARFGLVEGRTTSIGVAAIDRCGDAVIDLGASTLRAEPRSAGANVDDVVAIDDDGIASFAVGAQSAGADFDLVLVSPGLEELRYRVDGVDGSAVDEVAIDVATADGDAGTAVCWGRAYADGVDVIGLNFAWSADGRVSLDNLASPAMTATVAAPETDSAGNVVDAPAQVYASVLGEDASLDLLAVTSSALVAARDAAPARSTDDDTDDTSTTSAGCSGEGTTCDPLAAGVPFLALQRLRRRRRPRSGT